MPYTKAKADYQLLNLAWLPFVINDSDNIPEATI